MTKSMALQILGEPLPLSLTRDHFARCFAVSRETQEKFAQYHALLLAEQARWQLVSHATLPHFWQRHIADCAQAMPLLPSQPALVLDVGAGAGLPTIIWALLAPQLRFCVVESRRRKAEFLRRVARRLDLPIRLYISRAQNMQLSQLSEAPHVITARAVAPLAQLLHMTQFAFASADRRRASQAIAPPYAIFFKGKNWAKELTHARQSWTMDCKLWQSRTDKAACLLEIRHPIKIKH